MAATNHLADKTGNTTELLERLNDQQIREQIEHWKLAMETAQATESTFTAWRYRRAIALAANVLDQRSHV